MYSELTKTKHSDSTQETGHSAQTTPSRGEALRQLGLRYGRHGAWTAVQRHQSAQQALAHSVARDEPHVSAVLEEDCLRGLSRVDSDAIAGDDGAGRLVLLKLGARKLEHGGERRFRRHLQYLEGQVWIRRERDLELDLCAGLP